LSEALESGYVNGREVDKNVSTVFLLNKPVTLFVAKLLYCSFCQGANLLSKNLHYGAKSQVAALAKDGYPSERNQPVKAAAPLTPATIKQSPVKVKQQWNCSVERGTHPLHRKPTSPSRAVSVIHPEELWQK